ncbi:MAG: alanine racemase, partial [Clostridia bacterium]|nr:alanine racemase [Clostridia bacterium]
MQENIAIISLKNIKHNLSTLRSLLAPSVKVCAVVKANAYGHGVERVALSLEPFANAFAVTSIGEGIALRAAGVEKEILVFTPPLSETDAAIATLHELTLTVCNFSSLFITQAAAEKFSLSPRVQVKVNTGMNRLGLCGGAFSRLCSALAEEKRIRVTGIYSHLYAPENRAAANEQLKRFIAEKAVAERFLGKLTAHLSATGGILRGKEFHFDLVRPGIGLYGYLPSGFENDKERLQLRPAMKLYTRALQTHTFTGGGVGYAKAEKNYEKLTAYRLGYADGVWRNSGKALNFIGNLCMDSGIREGKSRKYGARKLVFSNAEKYAKEMGTIPYEV